MEEENESQQKELEGFIEARKTESSSFALELEEAQARAEMCIRDSIIDWDEDEVIRAIAESTVVVADPLYRQVCPAHRNIVFVDFPHEACSGRMYHSIMRPFVCTPDDSV